MANLLVINPNTSANVTQALLHHLGNGLAQWNLHGATAAFGAPYIADERSYCQAGPAVLDAWSRAQAWAPPGGYQAVLVGCFGDPGLHALREEVCAISARPVLGLAEASVAALARNGVQRVAVVTGGLLWKPMLERWARASGHWVGGSEAVKVVHVEALALTGAQLMAAPELAAQQLAHACRASLRGHAADAVILGGAGLAGMGARVRQLVQAPVWDCVEAVQAQLAALALQAPTGGPHPA
jgi:allantoin racemase